MTKAELTVLFNKCIIVQDGNRATICFETEEEANAAFNYLAELGTMPLCQMGEHACKDQSQCWEPCGALGYSMEHAVADNTELHRDTCPARSGGSNYCICGLWV